jgi:CRISPR-associated endonuclease/helicase Cas3
MNFYSHKEILLKDHLKNVGNCAKSFIEKLNLKYKDLSEIGCIIGKSHDLGKYTSYFQQHLNGENIGNKAHHSLLSAIFGAYIIKNYLETHTDINIPHKNFLPLISYLIIYKHHGDLRSPEEIIPLKVELKDYPNLTRINSLLREEIIIVRKQLDDIKKNSKIIQKEIDDLNLQFDISNFTDKNILETFNILADLRYKLLECEDIKECERVEIYFLTLLLYSVLIDSDKKTAGREEILLVDRRNIPSEIVDRYVEKKFKECESSLINEMRKEIYCKITQRAKEIPLDKKILTLTAPTGSGKTLTALSFALKLRERIRTSEGFYPRIVYSLPFINIIEQNYNVFYEVLSLLTDFEENASSYLIKHHHFANLEYKENNELKPTEEALLLTESWESEIIVTTFVQFLHSVIAFKNSFLKKFHNIAGSIIILDEIQNIPVEYWNLVDKILQGLVDFLGSRIILMTATKPLLFQRNSIELLENNEYYFYKLNRVTLRFQKEEITDNEFVEKFSQEFDKKSCLIVVNTISKSINLYKNIKKQLNYYGFVEFIKDNSEYKNIFDKEKNFEKCIEKLFEHEKIIFYLSTNVTPLQRAVRIKALKEFLAKGGKPILVSTQVVEAGVDLDFDVVFRDIGPLDSIIQVAGRCNRNQSDTKHGKVYLINLKEGGAENVYGKVHLFITKKLLKDDIIEEKDFFNLIKNYFPDIQKRTNDESKEILEAILKLNFYHSQTTSISKFKLIKEKGKFFDIFVEIDKEALEIKEKFMKEVIEERDFVKRKSAYYQLKKKFNEYLLSVREEKLKNNFIFEIDENLFYVPYFKIEDCYDIETGFKTKSDETIIF